MRRWTWLAWVLAAAVGNAQTARLTVTVVDPQRQPVPGVAVSVSAEGDSNDAEPRHAGRTSAAGRISFEALGVGRHGVSLRGDLYHDWWSGALDLRPGDNALEATLWPRQEATPPAVVEVLVIGRDGRPAVNTEVEVDTRSEGPPPSPRPVWLGGLAPRAMYPGCGQSGVMTTDARGRICFQAPPGRLNVCVTARHEEARGHTVWAPAGQVTWTRAYLAEAAPPDPEPEPEPDSAMVRLAGRVLDGRGQPRPRLRIALWSERDDEGPSWQAATRARQCTECTTDDQGRFEVDWRASRCPVIVKAAGWCSSEAEDFEPKAMLPTEFRLSEPAHTARGRVVDGQGQPVPGAVAWALATGEYDTDEVPSLPRFEPGLAGAAGIAGLVSGPLLAVRCDAEGRFAFDQLDHRRYRLLANAPGWGKPSMAAWSADAPPAEPLTLTLTRMGSVAGRVYRPDGTPWAGAPIRLGCGGDRALDGWFVADERGFWRLSGEPPGRSMYIVSLPGCQELRAALDVRGGETTTWHLRPVAGHVLTGRVLHGNGTPAAWARVVCPAPSGEPRVTWTDGEGRFRLTGLRTGDRQLDISSALGDEVPVYVTLPRVEPLTIRLPRRATLSGRVVDAAGRPVAKASCWLWRSNGKDDDPTVATDADGRFEFPALSAGDWTLRVGVDDDWMAMREVTLSAGERRTDLLVRVSSAHDKAVLPGSARGRVLRLDGAPAAGARLRWHDSSSISRPEVVADADGVYRITGAVAGPVRVSVDADGCTGDDVTGTVKAGAEAVLPDIRLVTCLVTGRLVNLPPGIRPQSCLIDSGVLALAADGRELPDRDGCLLPPAATSDGREEHGTLPMVMFDFGFLVFPDAARAVGCLPRLMIDAEPVWAAADGSFKVPCKPGRQRLTVRALRPFDDMGAFVTLANVVIEVPVTGQEQLDLLASLPTATLAGRFTVPEPRPDADAWPPAVAAYPLDSWTPAAVVLAQRDGSWRLAGLAPGEYRIAYGRAFSGCRFTRAVARAGETVQVPCDASAGQTLRGRVRGKLPRGLVVTVESGGAVQSAAVGQDGRFAVPDLPPGDYRCRLWSGSANRLVRAPGVHRLPGAEALLDW